MASGAAKRRITRETVREVELDQAEEAEEDEATEDQHPEAPLFSPLLRRAKKIETVTVRRTDPEDPSKWIYLGAIATDTTESGLKTRWGGGTYRLEAKNAAGQIVPDGVRGVRVSGDPIFESEVEDRRWRKANGLPEKPVGAGPAAPALSVTELLRLIEEKEEKRRAEQLDREARARTEAEAREARDAATRLALEERKQKDADDREDRKAKEAEAREDRRRNEAREDDERRSRVHREDMERLAAQNTTALQQTQQFFTQLASIMKAEAKVPANDPVKMLLDGVDLAQKLGGGGGGGAPTDEGPVAALVRRLPETLAEARRTGAAALSELRRGRGAGAARPDALTITGALAVKAKSVLHKLQAAGKDPEAEMDRLLTFAAAAIPDAPAAAAPARRPAPAAAPARRPALARHRRKAPPPPRIVKRRA